MSGLEEADDCNEAGAGSERFRASIGAWARVEARFRLERGTYGV